MDISSVIRAVRFSFRATDGGFEGSHDTHAVAIDSLGTVAFTPAVPSADGSGSARTGAPLSLETTSVHRGAARVDAPAGPPAVDRDGSLWTPRGPVIEHLRNGEAGVEQSWLFPWRPEGTGELEVRVRAAGLDPAGETGSGHHFVDPVSGLGVRYGHAVWVDRIGQTTDVPVRLEGSTLVLAVPASVVEGSVFPAVLDPVIEAELEVDRPVAAAPFAPAEPAIASGGSGGITVVAWADTGRGGLWAARLDATGGVLDPDGYQLSSDATAARPALAYGTSGTQFLVAWMTSSGVVYRRLQATAQGWTPLDAVPVALPGTAGGDATPSVAYEPQSGRFLVAWQRGANILAYLYPQPSASPPGVQTIGANAVVPASGLLPGPRVAAGSTGRLLVAWPTASGAQARRIAGADGALNAAITGVTNAPADRVDVAASANEWVVVATNTSSGQLLGRRITNGGTAAATPVTLTSGAGSKFAPALAWSSTATTSTFVLAWLVNPTSPQVYYQYVTTTGTNNSATISPGNAAGTLLWFGASATTYTRLGIGKATETFIAWTALTEVRQARIGTTPAGRTGEGAVSQRPTGAQVLPAVASNGTDHLVVWQDARRGSSDVYGARVSGAGALLGAPFAITATTANETAPAVASDGAGYLVVWSDGAVRGALVSGATGAVSAPVAISAGATGQVDPRVAFAAGAGYLAVWTDASVPGQPNVQGARLSAAGAVQGSPASISAGSWAEGVPDVAAAPSGDAFQVVWRDQRSGSARIYTARVSAAGAVTGTVAISPSAGPQDAPSIACSAAGCLAAWTDSRGADQDVYAARLDAAGAVLDATALDLSPSTGAQIQPSVAFEGRDYVVAFVDYGSGPSQLRGNRVGPSGALLDEAGVLLGTGTDGSGRPRLASARAGRALLAFTKPSTSLPGVDGVWVRALAYRNGLSLVKNGNGRVSSSPAGVYCAAGCSGVDASFDAGASVVLTAAPEENHQFSGWSGDCTGAAATCTVVVSAARSVTATFAPITWPLTVARSPAAGGTVNEGTGAISCGSTCGASFTQSTVVHLTAAASAGYSFTGWSGDCTGTAAACDVTMDAAKSVTASFDLVYHDVTATASPGPGGGVAFSATGSGGSCGSSCTRYLDGTEVTLTPQPAQGYRFAGWTGDCSGTTAPPPACTLLADGPKSATATFEVIPPVTHTLAVTKTGQGTVATAPGTTPELSCGLLCSATSATYVENVPVTLEATPDAGFSFGGWGGACETSGTAPSCTVTMSGDLAVSARFDALPPPPRQLDVAVSGTGAGTVTSSPAGISCPGDCTEQFSSGTVVRLTATPATAAQAGASNVFTGWGGACSGLTATCDVTLDVARSVTAGFGYVPPTYRALTVTNPGGGTVTDGGALVCPGACGNSYLDGTAVTLTATPGAGGTFAGWSGACAGTGACTVTLDAAKDVTATFAFPVTASRSGSGTGTVTSSPRDASNAISCGASCSGTFAYGTALTLTATPTAPAVFSGWSLAGCPGIGACTFTVAGPTAVTATFTVPPPLRYDLSVSTSGAGSGTVGSDLGGISCPGTCGATYDAGTVVNLTAAPSGGSVFAGWSGGCTGTTSPCTVTLDAARSVGARFEPAPPSSYLLSVGRSGSGTGTVTSAPAGISCGAACSASFSPGTSVALTPQPSPGSTFAGWSGGCTGTGACTVEMTAPRNVTATFSKTPSSGPGSYPLATAVGGPGTGTVTADADLGLSCDRSALCVVDVARSSPPRVVTLRANAAAGSRFAGWVDGCSGTGDCVLAMDRSNLARAVFVPRLSQLTVSLDGRGAVTDPAGAVACSGSTCAGSFETAGGPVALTARADAGWRFAGWGGGGCSGTGTCTVSPDRDRSLAARFVPDEFKLTVRALGGAGASRVTGGGIDCTGASGTCEVWVPNTAPASSVTLTAAPDGDSVFLGWGNGCGASPTCTFQVGAPTLAIATFGPKTFPATIQLIGLGTGTVTGGGLACTTGSAAGCAGDVAKGPVTFEAVPGDGSFFYGWGGVCPRTSDPLCTVNFLGSGTVQAVFEPLTLPLQVTISGPGSVSGLGTPCTGAGAVCTGHIDNTQAPGHAQVTLTATPTGGATFWGWAGACGGNTPTCTVTMEGAQYVTAFFLP